MVVWFDLVFGEFVLSQEFSTCCYFKKKIPCTFSAMYVKIVKYINCCMLSPPQSTPENSKKKTRNKLEKKT
jgi:hypothetical protein